MYKGANIKRIREQKNISGKRLAELAGYAPSYISELEHDKPMPTVKTICDIAEALGVPTCVVMDEDYYYPYLGDTTFKVSDSNVVMNAEMFKELQELWVDTVQNSDMRDAEELLIYLRMKKEARENR